MPKPGDATITDARLRALYEYWMEKRGDRAMPARADIDPTEIPDLLPIVGLADVIEGADDIVVKLSMYCGRNVSGNCLAAK